jgi:hypothetical protein
MQSLINIKWIYPAWNILIICSILFFFSTIVFYLKNTKSRKKIINYFLISYFVFFVIAIFIKPDLSISEESKYYNLSFTSLKNTYNKSFDSNLPDKGLFNPVKFSIGCSMDKDSNIIDINHWRFNYSNMQLGVYWVNVSVPVFVIKENKVFYEINGKWYFQFNNLKIFEIEKTYEGVCN